MAYRPTYGILYPCMKFIILANVNSVSTTTHKIAPVQHTWLIDFIIVVLQV